MLTLPPWNDAEHWHDRATDMRVLAENETLDLKAAMLHIADGYDLIGDRAEARYQLLIVPQSTSSRG
jgi:hypothetical protein